MIGQRLGQYEIVEQIGKGGMATVFRAFHPRTGRDVAVKVIHGAIALDDTSLERFQREAQLVARLEHPHLLPLYDYDGANDPPYIVMRYLESGTLSDVLERERLPLGEVAYMFSQICSGLDYAHRQGVVHRDIKPSNIMVDADGNAFVTDFGIARISDAGGKGLTQTGFAVGTPGYISPEQALGEMDVDLRSDVYALGVMLFEIVTGRLPYEADSGMAVLLKHVQAPVPDPREVDVEIPDAVAEVVMKAMAKERDARYQGANELAAAFNDAVIDSGMALRGSSPARIRQAAQSAINQLQREREANADVIQQTMADFEATRYDQVGSTSSVPDVGGPTMPDVAATRLDDVPYTQPERSGPPILMIVGGVVALLTVGVGLFLVLGAGGRADAQATAVAMEIRQTNAAIATATFEARPTNTPTQRPSAIPPDTDVPTQAVVVPADTDEPEATDTEAPEATDTDEPTRVVAQVATATHTPGSLPPVATLAPLPTDTDVPTRTPSNTPTDRPTSTPTNTPTATNTNTPTVTPTATSSIPLVTIRRNAIARLGPGNGYPVEFDLRPGDIIEVIGVSEDSEWYQLRLPDGTIGWVANDPTIIQTAGNVAGVAVALAPTNTPTNTPTPTPTATFTPTFTLTPTATSTPTLTPTATPTVPPTLTPSFTPSPTPDVTQPPTATPTPRVGRFPYVADFEGDDGLAAWDADPSVWQVVNEGGENLLIGQGRLTDPARIAGLAQPEWLEPTGEDVVINFDINMDNLAAGARYVFRFSDDGYYVLELFPGLMILKRNNPTPDIFERTTERVIAQANGLNLPANDWQEIRVWVEGQRIYVYLNERLVMTAEDLITPQLGPGQMILQVNSTTRPVRFDDVIIQRADPVSDHFEVGNVPSTWGTTNFTNTTIGREPDGNQYLRIERAAVVTPQTQPIQDLRMTMRTYNENGGWAMNIRESGAGSIRFSLDAGNMSIQQLDGAGDQIVAYNVPNFYNRNRWEDVSIIAVGDRLQIYRDGQIRFDEQLPVLTPAGGIFFETRDVDIMRFDDVLITETSASSNEVARFAYDLINTTEARLFRELRSDLTEDFSEQFRTDDWWVGGVNAPGEYVNNPNSNPENQRYLEMIGTGGPTWRLFRDVIGIEIFRSGSDTIAFSNSTDIYVQLQMNFPDAPGTGYVVVRATPTISRANVLGYRMIVQGNADGTASFQIRHDTETSQEVLFEGGLPGDEGRIFSDWIDLEIVTFEDRLAFFVDGTFLTAVDNAETLGGTLALGVEPGSTVRFDTLIIRDTTPHDQ
jgi:hypothetical protein